VRREPVISQFIAQALIWHAVWLIFVTVAWLAVLAVFVGGEASRDASYNLFGSMPILIAYGVAAFLPNLLIAMVVWMVRQRSSISSRLLISALAAGGTWVVVSTVLYINPLDGTPPVLWDPVYVACAGILYALLLSITVIGPSRLRHG